MAMTGMQQRVAANPGALGSCVNSLSAPRALGFVERATGLASGLEQLERCIEALVSRIEGGSQKGEACTTAVTEAPPGLSSQLSDAEDRLRSCVSLIDELHNRF